LPLDEIVTVKHFLNGGRHFGSIASSIDLPTSTHHSIAAILG
jgi:hypothetical protein